MAVVVSHVPHGTVLGVDFLGLAESTWHYILRHSFPAYFTVLARFPFSNLDLHSTFDPSILSMSQSQITNTPTAGSWSKPADFVFSVDLFFFIREYPL